MTDTQTLRVEGMTCASCTSRIERLLAREDGVTGVRANLMTGTVAFDGQAQPADLAAKLSAAGFTASEDVTRLAIGGMTCASCVSRVERVLEKQPGVTSASVNLADESATVRHLAVTGLPEKLAESVRAAGYEARIATETSRADVAEHKAEEQGKLARAVILAAVLTLPVFVLEMGGHMVPAFHHWLHGLVGQFPLWVAQFVLTSVVLFGPGWRFFKAGVPALLHAAPDMNSLVVLGATAAWGYSTIATFAPGLLPEASIAVYYEAAAMIVTLILLGRYLEARAKGRTGAAIAKLVGLQAQTARVERDGQVEEVAIDQVAVGDLLHLRPGERVAVDGSVASGHSWLDESMITGEPIPVEKSPGETLTAGTVNGTSALTYRAERVGADTVLARIIRMVEEAQGAKLPIQATVDRVTRVFVPIVMAVAALTFAVWMIWGPGLSHALVAAVAVLIIACPCAMGLATPTSIMVGTGRGAEMGVLFRRGDALQALQGVQVVAFDKTGTLTEGRPELVGVHTAPGADDAQALAIAAAAESGSEHPIASAVLRAAKERGLTLPKAEDVTALTGFGLQARVDGKAVLIGAQRLMDRDSIALGDLPEHAAKGAAHRQTPLYIAVDGQAVALLLVADRLKPSTKAAIDALHALSVQTAMITGDARGTAQAIAAELGIDHIEAEVLPDGKVAAIETLRQGGRSVAFVGDGINDAPALAAADVGLAIGTGTDVAVEAAEVVLMSGDLRGVVNAIHLSRAVLRNIRQNLFWAFAYNAALIPVAAGVLYPGFGITLSPVLGAGAMALSSIFVLTNALRLKTLRPALEAA
ncbi:heavy metal translocating P-type ATPase [Pararhodobacter zhoushanensis]|uniref:Heavy metal translocating P-type ATPase n=1 Tax=Pararhodobacter zhoushanensis TaxID=2479545 RepID=A0ABT3GX99_9RHOB|nr:heavy metal translocating P-type ATPase [Pararhodobacter zhoushanensis]MCW1404176.1 heavy metal translocating P-type ATPase [Novosphingobium sp. MW5]MCW1932146.1 heavy metal translocating P-type ATPase [Pararhodobacter zhoushanensis]